MNSVRTMLSIAERNKLNVWLCGNVDFCGNHTLGEITRAANAYTQLNAKPTQVVSSLKALEIPYAVSHTRQKPAVSVNETPDYIRLIAKMLLQIEGQLPREEVPNTLLHIRILAGLSP